MVQDIGDIYNSQFRGETPKVIIELTLVDSTNSSSAVWEVNNSERVVIDSHYKSRWRIRIIEDDLSKEEKYCDDTANIRDTVEQLYGFADVIWVDNNHPDDILGQ